MDCFALRLILEIGLGLMNCMHCYWSQWHAGVTPKIDSYDFAKDPLRTTAGVVCAYRLIRFKGDRDALLIATCGPGAHTLRKVKVLCGIRWRESSTAKLRWFKRQLQNQKSWETSKKCLFIAWLRHGGASIGSFGISRDARLWRQKINWWDCLMISQPWALKAKHDDLQKQRLDTLI